MYYDRRSINPVTIKRFTRIFFLAVICTSCSHYYYVPNVQNVPLFREKNSIAFQENMDWELKPVA